MVDSGVGGGRGMMGISWHEEGHSWHARAVVWSAMHLQRTREALQSHGAMQVAALREERAVKSCSDGVGRDTTLLLRCYIEGLP